MQGNGTASCYESDYGGVCNCDPPAVRGDDGYSCVVLSQQVWVNDTALDNSTAANCTEDLFMGTKTCTYVDPSTGSVVLEVGELASFHKCASASAYSDQHRRCVSYSSEVDLSSYTYTSPAGHLGQCASSDDCFGETICWSEGYCWCPPSTRPHTQLGKCVWASDTEAYAGLLLPNTDRAQLADCSGNVCNWMDYSFLAATIWLNDSSQSLFVLTLPARGWIDPDSYPPYPLTPATTCEFGELLPETALCVCDAGYFGINCDQNYTTCANERCGGNGECANKAHGCVCSDGWSGDHCEQIVCANGGVAVDKTVCNCTERWKQPFCTEFVCGSTLHTYDAESGSCECNPNTIWEKNFWTGACTDHPCGGAGKGVPSGDGQSCRCEEGKTFQTDKGPPYCR